MEPRPFEAPAPMPICRALILLQENGVFRFAKMAAAVRAGVARRSGSRRRCFGHSKQSEPGMSGCECEQEPSRDGTAFCGPR
jgi:hypothetical protein